MGLEGEVFRCKEQPRASQAKRQPYLLRGKMRLNTPLRPAEEYKVEGSMMMASNRAGIGVAERAERAERAGKVRPAGGEQDKERGEGGAVYHRLGPGRAFDRGSARGIVYRPGWPPFEGTFSFP